LFFSEKRRLLIKKLQKNSDIDDVMHPYICGYASKIDQTAASSDRGPESYIPAGNE
jgi:hypothetical protein